MSFGTASRTINLLGGILAYAVELGIIEQNPLYGGEQAEDLRTIRSLISLGLICVVSGLHSS